MKLLIKITQTFIDLIYGKELLILNAMLNLLAIGCILDLIWGLHPRDISLKVLITDIFVWWVFNKKPIKK